MIATTGGCAFKCPQQEATPGSNATGLSKPANELGIKILQLLKEVFLHLVRGTGRPSTNVRLR